MTATALYTDLSGYYDLMCADINYQAQSDTVHRIDQFFGNGGKRHLDLACGTGPHIRFLLDLGYQSAGLDLNQPMLELAQQRCPEADFSCQNMCEFSVSQPVDLITCFLYSLHYSQTIAGLTACIRQAHQALNAGGVFCFNAVDKSQIDNASVVSHQTQQATSRFVFTSGWFYPGHGEQQQLRLRIEKTENDQTEIWQDAHPMVAVTFAQLQQLLAPYFDVQILQHDYDKLVAWDGMSGNALFVCVKH
ncbi:class I SAM-dependent methyltransferase [Rheinheimera sp. F8]|uniref:class I SAM-dependent DNA methyltransferase n=1 Tax=Rheinheimera sp. F8 TaxID=1763998 RepID=UPI000744A42A|nr:class I SAM-dependent methyltransferase [Rheinheimera sp. F8]ALZ75257.1 SAM-dependent methyltransferase [Rheinheimera sp. F8]ALZ76318.1 SAM-dependent methyltransferase [Rheinheimera sp. F8]